MKKTLAIVGGGAAGLIAACAAGRNAGELLHIVVLEAGDRVGKKILASGNGRCNMTNMDLSPGFYHGLECGYEQNSFVMPALSYFSVEKAISFFASIGLMCRTEEGRVYPYCNQASAVLDVLRNEAVRFGIETIHNFKVTRISKRRNTFQIFCDTKALPPTLASSVIITTGGCASPALGSNGSGFKLLEQNGHRITDLYPGLVQLKTDNTLVKGLQGIRFFGKISLFEKEPPCRHIASSCGEMLFTEYGLSGIPVMEISSYIRHSRVYASIDYLPDYDLQKLKQYLTHRVECLSHLYSDMFLTGMINKKIGQALMKISGVEKLSFPVKAIQAEHIDRIAHSLKNMVLPITGTNGFTNAQITVGGASLSEFSPYTMESKKVKGLYAAGEILDVHGDCGGYNLHWAWASGYLAGVSAVQREGD